MKSHSITLVTDSTCDLPASLRESYAIHVVPLSVIWGSEQLREGIDIQPQEFYRRLVKDPIYPTTSQPTPQEFLRVFEKVRDDGAQEIIVITISSAMSGTLESARLASTLIDIPVHLVDSKTNSMGLGWQVLAAARVREAGGDVTAMIAAANMVRKRTFYLISLDTLDYLHKGGRIGRASHFIGTLLNFKPQIKVNHETGEVEAGRRSRTRKRALSALYKDFFERVDGHKKLHLSVLHNDAFPEAEMLVERIRNEFAPEEIITGFVSPVLGVHTGPRAISLCGYIED